MLNKMFRAWDNERKEYISAGAILIAIERGKTEFFLDAYDEKGKQFFDKNRWTIEQYTTVTVNGVNWYENDIVTDGRFTFVIIWSNELITWLLWNPSLKGVLPFASYAFKKQLKCIGNIHENKDLLEVKA